MRAKDVAALAATLLCAALAAIAAAQPPQAVTQNPPPQPDHAVKVRTRVITVDVVATNSQGNIVRDLKPEELQISDNGPQKIAHFAFVDKSANAATGKLASQSLPKGVYSNQAPFEHMTIPPTVLLVDVLNTTIEAQATARKEIVRLMNILPDDAPVAVLLLNTRLALLQDFTTDPALSRAALDKAVSQSALLEVDPQLDPNSASNEYIRNAGGAGNGGRGTQDGLLPTIQTWEKLRYEDKMNARVDITAGALVEIAGYLRGYPGRKNLIWLSSSFPLSLFPRPDFGDQPNYGTNSYVDQVQKAANALSDAQVAVNPVDPEGLAKGMLEPNMTGLNTKVAEATMMQLAEDTGGRTCINTNDLSGCVATSLKDSSSYYELAYYPENVKWNGSFHAISVKTSRPGVTLSYRRGYYAVDQEALAKQLPPEKQLEQRCDDLLPATSIPVTARAIPPVKPGEFGYVVTVPADAFDLESGGASRSLSARMAICEYSAKSGGFHFTMRDLTRAISDTAYQELEARGVREFVNIPPQAGTQRVRFVVLDQRTGLTGAVDVPLNPGDWVNPASRAPEGSSSPPVTSIGFSVASGQSATLDWGGSKLVYEGDLGVDRSAPAFFHDSFMPAFQCESGKLIPRDSSSNATPNLHFTFTNPSGQTAMVDLSGTEPEYSGTLPVDPNASAFFLRLWYLCHCTSP